MSLLFGKLLSLLPLYQALLVASLAACILAVWTLVFYHRQKPVQFVRSIRSVSVAPVDSVELWKTTDRLMTCQLHGRVGNMMFAYASLVGISWKNNRTPALPESHFLRSAFHIKAAVLPEMSSGSTTVAELWAGAYASRFEWVDSNKELLGLIGYFQSWRYFIGVEQEIRAQFTFRHHLSTAVDRFIQSTIRENYGLNVRRRDVILIGIHVRVGDMAFSVNVKRGYTVASPEYLAAAMSWYRHRLPYDRLLFILATDDRNWCRSKFPYGSSDKVSVVHTLPGADVQDLAILAACNHTIITVGSFGWWAAWLANGLTVYYKNFPKLNSSLADEYVLSDYYPDTWIGISGM